ncbi:FecR domain-containing protein [Labrenzia sp. R4_2]|nr:FecR domain-containing protein [Labrenzia sp. R4_2]
MRWAAVGATALLSLLVNETVQATTVGTAAAVNTDAFGTPPGAVRQVKLLGDNVLYNERIETSGSGLVQVLLNDGSTFTVGANSDLVIDEFVYDPNAGTGKLVASFGKGVVRFVGGKVSKQKGGVSVKTPVGTIGIRGGMANLNLNGDNPVFSLLFGDELTFTGSDGTNRRIYSAGYSLQVGTGGQRGGVRRTTPADLASAQSGLTARSGQSGGTRTPPTARQIARSGVPNINSRLGHIRTAPVPKPRSVQPRSPARAEANLLQVQKNTQQRTINQLANEIIGGNDPTGGDEDTTDGKEDVAEGGGTTDKTGDGGGTPDRTGDDIDGGDIAGGTGDTGGETVETTDVVRILTAGVEFIPSWDTTHTVLAPGAQGLIGGSRGTDMPVTFTVGEITSGTATALYKAEVEGNKIYQFAFEGDGQYYYAQTYTDQDVVAQLGESDFIPVAPTVNPETEGNVTSYAWGVQYYHEDFAAFAHLPNVMPGGTTKFDIESMVVGIHGVGTDFSSFGDASGTQSIRIYDLATDPTLAFSLGTAGDGRTFTPLITEALFVNPLAAAELGESFLQDVTSTGLLMIESDPATLERAHYLAGSFHIDGTGETQKSFISLAVGDVAADEASGLLSMKTDRRGGHRIASSQSAALYSGPVGTIAGPDDGHFFGSNAQSFVFGNALADGGIDDAYDDSYVSQPDIFPAPATVSSSLHVARLSGTVDATILTRSDRTLSGYAAGVLESSINLSGQGVGPVVFASESAADLSVTFNGAEYSLGGSLTVRDSQDLDPDVAAYTVRFGSNSDGSSTDRATLIGNDLYAARDASNHLETYLTVDTVEPVVPGPGPDPNPDPYLYPTGGGGGTGPYTGLAEPRNEGLEGVQQAASRVASALASDAGHTLQQDPSQDANTYFVPNTLIGTADDAIMAGTTECTCAFLEWGYWGTKLSYDDTGGVLDGANSRKDAFHLGTWVAGDVTNAADLPTSGSASYVGHAAGSVVNNGAQYLAAGDFRMTVDFARRTGSANIANFDGRTFGADLTERAVDVGNQFSGNLVGSVGSGSINTSIVGGPSSNYDGVIGNFNAVDGTWSASGIVAGEMN